MDRMAGKERGGGRRAADKERGDDGRPARTGATPSGEDRGAPSQTGCRLDRGRLICLRIIPNFIKSKDKTSQLYAHYNR